MGWYFNRYMCRKGLSKQDLTVQIFHTPQEGLSSGLAFGQLWSLKIFCLSLFCVAVTKNEHLKLNTMHIKKRFIWLTILVAGRFQRASQQHPDESPPVTSQHGRKWISVEGACMQKLSWGKRKQEPKAKNPSSKTMHSPGNWPIPWDLTQSCKAALTHSWGPKCLPLGPASWQFYYLNTATLGTSFQLVSHWANHSVLSYGSIFIHQRSRAAWYQFD